MTSNIAHLQSRSGMVAIVGRPNVGKSTLLNKLLGQKISITSPKPQTTRYQILGVLTRGNDQIVWVDTPGIMSKRTCALDRYMLRVALQNLGNVEAIVFVVEALRWTEADEQVAAKLVKYACPKILVINKVDLVNEKRQLLPYIEKLSKVIPFHAIVPVSARRRENLLDLEKVVLDILPSGSHMFAEDQITDRSQRFLASEIVREKLLRRLNQEVPHKLSVDVAQFEESEHIVHIAVTIWVERENHKAIVIGGKGLTLKAVGEQSRIDLERMIGKQVFLELWVKVREHWSDDEVALQQLGYNN